MSLLSELTVFKNSTKDRKRVGRGDGSGSGGTAGKGHKGQKARTGGKVRRGFEGGQMPIHRRFPKFGFTNHRFQINYNIVNLNQLSKVEGNIISYETLAQAGLIKIKKAPVKLLGKGEVKQAYVVKVNRFSDKAKSAIESAGGKIEVIESCQASKD